MASLVAAAASTSAAKRRLPMIMSFCGRVRSSTCSFDRRERERRERERGSEGGKLGKARKIFGAPPEDLERRSSHRRHVPPDYVIPAPCISETKCYDEIKSAVSQPSTAEEEEATHTHTQTHSSPKPNPKHDSFVHSYTSNTSQNLSDIFVHSYDKNHHAYFTAYSIDEDDGSLSPKYYIYPPPPLNQNWFFLGATCNGLFHFLNAAWEHLLWNSASDELMTLPTSFVERPLLRSFQVGTGMWSSHHTNRQNYKLLQLVLTYTLDEEGDFTDPCYCIWLYKLKSNSWKKIPCTYVSRILSAPSACINGVFYCAISLKVPHGAKAILSFDFSAETLSTVPLPPIADKLFYRILECKGLLSLLVYSCLEDVPTKYELWVRDDGVWSRESVFHVCGVQHPVWFSKNGQLLYFESFDYEVVVFDRAVGKSKNLGIYTHSRPLQFYPFVESYVQLDGVSVVEELEEEEDD